MSGLTCTICSEVYTNSDVIYSTTCGHIFHFSCMQQWRSRSSSCPQCREHNPQSHRIFLDFDETLNDQKLNEFTLQLDQSVKSRSELQLRLDEVERDFLEIQRILVETEDKKLDLEAANQFLKVQNESREQEMTKIITNCNLNASEEAELQHVKISSLEDKVREVLLELEQKTEDCLKFSEENFKLEKILERNNKLYANARNQYEAVERGLKVQIDHLNKEIIAGNELIQKQKNAIEELTTDNKSSENQKIHANKEDFICEYRKQSPSTNIEIKSSEMLIQKLKLERELENSIDKIMELEENLMRSKDIFDLEIESLKADNEWKDIEIKIRKEEHMKMMSKLSSLGSKPTEITLRKRNETLSTKLEDTRCELEKALQSSAEKDILIENFKHLESLLIKKQEHVENQVDLAVQFEKSESYDIKTSYPSNQSLNNNTQANGYEARSVLIRGVPESDIKTPLTETVFLFTEIMAIPCKPSDIIDVFKLENKFKTRNNIHRENISLVVKFSSLSMKTKFLKNKEMLKTKGIQVSEYVDNETNALFHHAKSLRSIGYKQIFCRNNNVFVKFNFKAPALKINSKQEVDDIIKNFNDRRKKTNEKSVEESKENCQNKLEEKYGRDGETKPEECDDAYYRKE